MRAAVDGIRAATAACLESMPCTWQEDWRELRVMKLSALRKTAEEESGRSGSNAGGKGRECKMKEPGNAPQTPTTDKHCSLDTKDPLAFNDAKISLEESVLQFKIVKKLLLRLLLERLTLICK